MSKRPNPPSKPGKGAHLGSLIALGQRTSSSSSASSSAPLPKKPKQKSVPTSSTAAKSLFADPVRAPSQSSSTAKSTSSGDGPLTDVSASDLLKVVESAVQANDHELVSRLIDGAIHNLKDSRIKPDANLNSALASLAVNWPQLFSTTSAVTGLVSVLQREQTLVFKLKSNPTVLIVAAQLLLVGLQKSRNWPEALAKAYVDDALSGRVWVDIEQCKKLVVNILTVFDADLSPLSQVPSGEGVQPYKGELPSIPVDSVPVEPRFAAQVEASVKSYVLQMIAEQTRRPQQGDIISKNLPQFLSVTAGWSEMRIMAAQKLEGWLQNPKPANQKFCQELMQSLVRHTREGFAEDCKVVEYLVSVRLRSKLLANQYMACIREIVSAHPNHLGVAIRTVIQNELSTARNPGNMTLLVMMIGANQDLSAKVIADVFLTLLAQKDDLHVTLRGLLREVVRQVKHNFSFSTFTHQLLQENKDAIFQQMEQTAKERMGVAVGDLVALSCMLTANLAVREVRNLYHKGDESVAPQLMEFYRNLGSIQCDLVHWMAEIVPNMYRLQPNDYKVCIKKALFFDAPETSKDNWPPEGEKGFIHRVMGEGCLLEDTLITILKIGLNHELPLSPSDALDIADRLVARAASFHNDVLPRLPAIDHLEIIKMILDISTYRPPSSVVFPDEYTPPVLAVSRLYWKAWVLLLVLASFNSTTLGSVVWREYSTLRGLMEMVTTRMYDFPPSMTLKRLQDGQLETKEEAIAKETQLARIEKTSILEYENYLASASKTKITEQNSLLLNQVTLFNPRGPIRRVPPTVIDLVKNATKSLNLGRMLCKCRSPDFLLEIIQLQGTSESMRWLSELVESSEDSLEALPIPCLCEFLLANQNAERDQDGSSDENAESSSHREKYRKPKAQQKTKLSERFEQLVSKLQSLVFGSDATPRTSWEVIEYFLQKLCSQQQIQQSAILKCLGTILTPERSDEFSWLTEGLKRAKYINHFRGKLCQALIQVCKTVMDVTLFHCLLVALAEHSTSECLLENLESLSTILQQRLPLLEKSLSGQAVETGVATEAIGALLVMTSKALSIAMVTGLEVAKDDAIPDNHVAVWYKDQPRGRALLVSILNFSVQLLSMIDISVLKEGAHRECYEKLFYAWFPPDQSLTLLATNGQPYPLLSYQLKKKILGLNNTSLVRAALSCCTVRDLLPTLEFYGIPTINMQLILTELDRIVVESPQLVKQAVQDEGKLARAVHLQRTRQGVDAGTHLLEFCASSSPLPSGNTNNILSLLAQNISSREAVEPMDEGDTRPSSTSFPIEKGNVKEMKKCFVQYYKATTKRDGSGDLGVDLLKFLNTCMVDEKPVDTVKILFQGLKEAIHQKALLEQFCRHPMSPILVSSMCKVSVSKPELKELTKKLLKDVYDCSARNKIQTMVKVADHWQLELFGHVKQNGDSRESPLELLKDKLSSGEDLMFNSPSFVEDVQHVLLHYPRAAEDVIKTLAMKALKSGAIVEVVQLFSKLALSQSDGPSPSCHGYHGLLCDWLCVFAVSASDSPVGLDPIMELAFGCRKGTRSLSSSQNLFITHLVHESNWVTIYNLMLKLLTEMRGKTLDPTAVMDFLWACLNKPHLWRGVAQKEGVVNPYLSLGINTQCRWTLSCDTLSVLVGYCLREGHLTGNLDNGDQSKVLQSRIPLLYSCCGHSRDTMAKLIENVKLGEENFPEASKQLYALLYVALGIGGSPQGDLPLTTSLMDAWIHSLLIQLAANSQSNVSSGSTAQATISRIGEAGLICKKLAHSHPRLMIRHLPVLSALLRGRTVNRASSAKNIHTAVLQQSFEIIEHLKPQVFQTANSNGLNTCLQSYFEFIESQCGSQKYEGLVERISSFLVLYLHHNRCEAAAVIKANIKILEDYYATSSSSSKRTSVLSLVECFSFTSQQRTLQDEREERGDEGRSSSPVVCIPPQITSNLSRDKLIPYLKKLVPGQSITEVMKVLQELDETSLHSVDIIQHFVPDLCRLLRSSDPQACRMAHQLIKRHLNYSPSDMNKLIPVLKSGLSCDNKDIVVVTMTTIIDLLPLCGGSEAVELLDKLFDLVLRVDYSWRDKLLRAIQTATGHLIK